jgi:hypothetical protein
MALGFQTKSKRGLREFRFRSNQARDQEKENKQEENKQEKGGKEKSTGDNERNIRLRIIGKV